MNEQWTVVESFDNYEVSDHGRVRRIVGKHTALKGSLVRGYRRVNLYKDGKAYSRKVARLVAQAFIPNPLGLPEINHKKNPKTNDHIFNLEWATRSQQIKHALDNGLYHRGSQLAHHKLTTKDIKKVRDMSAVGLSNRRIATTFGVHHSTIASVVRQTERRLFRVRRARFTFSRISAARAVQMNGFGLSLWRSM